MLNRFLIACATLLCVSLITPQIVSPASALTSAECSKKYKAAQSAGTLGGMKWKDFEKTQCADAAATSTTTTTSNKKPVASKANTVLPVFPGAVSSKYANEAPGKARMHTCLDQYKANKVTNANGGLRWIEKGGGYYSECTKHLKV